jgi:LCP family protein required for cell wall assembly
MSDPRSEHPHARRWFLGVTATLSAVVMLVASIGMATYVWANGQRPVLPTEDTPFYETGPNGQVTEAPKAITGRCITGASCNYLLLGSDSRANLTKAEQEANGTDAQIGGENRADTIILVHTEPDKKTAVFLSFPRDLWVDIPGQGENKINAAFSRGVANHGADDVARTVRALTGIPIQHVMYVDLGSFQGLVDTLGGVNMCVPYAMQDELTGLDIQAGCQHFDGTTALAYVRTRHQPCDGAAPDFARIARQQQFLRSVIAKILQPSELVHLPSLVPALLKNLAVDEGMNVTELAYLAGQLQGVGTDNADFRSVPSYGASEYDASGTFLSVVKPTEPDATELFRRLRNGQPLGDLGIELPGVPPSPANIVTPVVDVHSGDVAADALERLTESGFNSSPGVVTPDDIKPPKKGSMILYREGLDAEAKVVGQYFPDLELVPAPANTLPNGQDVAVVVTGNYEIPPLNAEEPVDCPTT